MASVDLLVVHRVDGDLSGVIASALRTTIESVYDDPPDNIQELLTAIQIRYSQPVEGERILTGVSVTVDVPDESSQYVIAELLELINADETTLHMLKLGDESQLAIAHSYLDEIYQLEMKLREALTVIFITSMDCGYYEFLLDIDISLQADLRPEQLVERMRRYCENEFFYILFSDYRKVTIRKRLSNTSLLIEVISAAETLDDLKERLLPRIPLSEPYEDFLASLSAGLDPIEAVRNCVMHNRTISNKQAQDYKSSYEKLLERIESFLGSVQATIDAQL